MNRKIIISIPFNINLGIYSKDIPAVKEKFASTFPIAQTQDWINARLYLFVKYTLTSLVHQTSLNYLCLVRHTAETASLIQRELSRYSPLPPNIIFTPNADQIITDVMNNCDVLYHISLDSDNMYSPDFIAKLSAFTPKPDTLSIVCQNGYIYNEATRELAQLFHPSPSFYAAVYTKQTFYPLYAQRLYENHWNAVNYPYESLEGNNFCIIAHSSNLDNNFNAIVSYFKARLVTGYEKQLILNKWHL